MIQVVSHFVDPPAAVRAASRLLTDGGLLLVETWDRTSLTARLFGRRWHEYSPPSVLHWFSRNGLDRLMSTMDLQRIASGRPSKWIRFGHALSLVRHKLSTSWWGNIATIPLGLVPSGLNLPYPGNDVFWSLYQRRSEREF